ncbi:FAD-dependent oxidoreductase [Metaplanococcus flavidus]|uniref:FAD-dependent oxidoreductase n=1 Tax=Metaplanococcus flavidus TaxID=569883 RepID=A0ABW3L815_9BACL
MKTLVLVGGGHAHLHCLEQMNKQSLPGWRVLLISSSVHQYYSGMFSGFTEGVYTLEDIRIDLKRLCEKIGADFKADRIVSIDPHSRQLTGAHGSVYGYDLVSFDIGSITAVPQGFQQQISTIKPNHLFPEQLMRIREAVSPVIVGGGASGIELSFSIHAWRKQRQLPANVVLLSSTPLLHSQGNGVADTIEAIADRKALPYYTGEKVEQIDDDRVYTHNGRSFPQSDVLWLTGPSSTDLFKSSGVPTNHRGFLLVTNQLQSVEYPEMFGAGDCISIEENPNLPKNGVYAVRQGPILWHNLMNSAVSDKLKSFNPQKRYLSILSTGDGEALLTYGKRRIHGKLPWLIKQTIDRQFMKRYKKLYE